MATTRRRSASTEGDAAPKKKRTRTPSNPAERGLVAVWIHGDVHARLALTQKLLALEFKQRDASATPMTMGAIAEEAIALHLATLIEKHGQSFALLMPGLPRDKK